VVAAAGEPYETKKPFKKGGDKQMAYLTATIKSLVKKGLKMVVKSEKRKCCSYDTSSSDSYLESEIRRRDTEVVVDKHLELDEPFMPDLHSIQPRPIKVTDSVLINIRADNKM
jgi:hypothetical protein